MKKKACSKCKIFVEGNECPICKNAQFTLTWKGRLYLLDKEHSVIAQKIELETNGEYAIKV